LTIHFLLLYLYSLKARKKVSSVCPFLSTNTSIIKTVKSHYWRNIFNFRYFFQQLNANCCTWTPRKTHMRWWWFNKLWNWCVTGMPINLDECWKNIPIRHTRAWQCPVRVAHQNQFERSAIASFTTNNS
jgi:hypothetical protein